MKKYCIENDIPNLIQIYEKLEVTHEKGNAYNIYAMALPRHEENSIENTKYDREFW